MQKLHTYQGTVYPWHCDHMGHMNVKFYVEMFDQAIWNLFNQLGLTANYLRDNSRGMAALEQHIKYHKEVLPGDCVYIESGVVEVRKDKLLLMRQYMHRLDTKELLAETETLGIHMDTQARKAATLPEFVLQKLST